MKSREIAFINIGGLTPRKTARLEQFLAAQNIDVLGICETWRDDMPWVPRGYIMCVREAEECLGGNRKKAGIIVVGREGLVCDVLERASRYGTGIRLGTLNVLFVYRPPSASAGADELVSGAFLEESESMRSVVVGDFNMRNDDREEDELCEHLAGFGVRRVHMRGCTLSRYGTSPDKVYTNADVRAAIVEADFTEHNFIRVGVGSSTAPREIRYSMFKAERRRDAIQRKMDRCLAGGAQPAPDAEYGRIESAFAESFRCTRTQVLPKAIRDLKKRKNRMRKDRGRDLGALNELRREIRTLVRRFKRCPGGSFAEQTRLVAEAVKKGQEERAYSVQECNEVLESFLVKGCSYGKKAVMPAKEDGRGLQRVECEELEELVATLKSGKSAGLSGIKNEMIKMATACMKKRIANLFNMILESQEVPEKWRRIVIHPIPKDANTHRPIALTESFRKLFEKMLAGRIEYRVSAQQGGFVRGLSTVDQAMILDSHLRRSNGRLKVVALDITKAYDSVDRRLLYRKLEARGMGAQMLRILVSLMEGNRCCVRKSGVRSRWARLTRGLPQGSILSPMLFNMFIDDIVLSLPEGDRHRILLYADDVLLFSHDCESLQGLVEALGGHACANRYEFNPDKCFYLSSEKYDFRVAGQPIKRKTRLKYLGYHFNAKGFDTKTRGVREGA